MGCILSPLRGLERVFLPLFEMRLSYDTDSSGTRFRFVGICVITCLLRNE